MALHNEIDRKIGRKNKHLILIYKQVWVAPSLTYIFKLSPKTGIYIDDWKHARVTPIFKSGERQQYANYHPIFILPPVSKVFEKEVFCQVYGYLTETVCCRNF